MFNCCQWVPILPKFRPRRRFSCGVAVWRCGGLTSAPDARGKITMASAVRVCPPTLADIGGVADCLYATGENPTALAGTEIACQHLPDAICWKESTHRPGGDTMYYIDPHIHMISRVTDDYHRMDHRDCVAARTRIGSVA